MKENNIERAARWDEAIVEASTVLLVISLAGGGTTLSVKDQLLLGTSAATLGTAAIALIARIVHEPKVRETITSLIASHKASRS